MDQATWFSIQTQEQINLKPWTLAAVVRTEQTDSVRVENLAAEFAPINLQQMDSVALLNRFDKKFILTIGQLLRTLAALAQGKSDYRILSVAGQRLNHYRTLYFDTQDFALYNQHVNERADRYKVRSREYLESQQSFLEVKHHTRKDRTIKSRVSTIQPTVRFDSVAEAWLQQEVPFDSRGLEPKLWNDFSRITLVNTAHCERVTIDVDLAFHTAHRLARFGNLAVAEVKQDGSSCASAFLAQMRALRVHPQGFSKYCIGTSLLYDHVKKNSLKEKLLWFEKNSIGVFYE